MAVMLIMTAISLGFLCFYWNVYLSWKRMGLASSSDKFVLWLVTAINAINLVFVIIRLIYNAG